MKEKEFVTVTIKIPKKVHRKIVDKQLNKYDKKKTIAELCSMAIEKCVDQL